MSLQEDNYLDMPKIKSLIVEDDELQRITLGQNLKVYGSVAFADSKSKAIGLLSETQKFDLVFLDLDLSDGDLLGLELIQPALECGAYVVVLSGHQGDEQVLTAYEMGCQDYLAKPFNKKSLELVLKKYLMVKASEKFSDVLARDFITRDKSLIHSLDVINEVVLSKEPVLITGATGTGKSFLASLIHKLIYKSKNGFIELNCSETPENLLEAELFGFEKGAFSGADSSKKGKFFLANGGTLFLDEVATMSDMLQMKLLKAIEEKKFYPLGSEKPVYSEFRLVSATCENLNQLVLEKKFREDLYFRLEGFNIHISPLAERKCDVNFLVKHFLKRADRRVVFTSDALKSLENYNWPGNARELQKLINRLSLNVNGVVKKEDLPNYILKNSHPCGAELGGIGEDTSGDEVVNLSDQDINDSEKSFYESLFSSNNVKYIEKYGLRSFIQQIEDKVVYHFYAKNNERVRKTLGQLKISNSSFYKVIKRIENNVESL